MAGSLSSRRRKLGAGDTGGSTSATRQVSTRAAVTGSKPVPQNAPVAGRWARFGTPRATGLRMWIAALGRLLLGGVWIAAGVLKMPDPAGSVRAVRAYRLLPEAVVPAIGYGLPFFEVALGALLLLGIAVRLAAVLSAVVLLAFVTGITSAWARGLQIDCGCFGGGGTVAAGHTHYAEEIARDVGLIIVALALARWPASRLSLFAADQSQERA